MTQIITMRIDAAKAGGFRALTTAYQLPREQAMLDSVLADMRRGRQRGIGGRRNAGSARHPKGRHVARFDGDGAAGGDDVRVGKPIVKAVDPVRKDVGATQHAEPMRGGLARENLTERRENGGAVLRPRQR